MSVGRDDRAGRVLVIAGCGYLGTALARLAQGRGWRVLGICQSEETVRRLGLMGIAAVAADFTDRESLARVAGEVPEDACVVHCAAGGKGGGLEAYRTVYLEGMRRLREAFPGARRMLYTSSTSVYAGIDGGEVTEESAAEPERETGRVLRQTEGETLGAGGAVVRLAAIDVRTEEPATPDGRWVNQIHRDDAAAAVLHLLEHPDGGVFHGGLYNVSDRRPLLQREIYERLAVRFGRPLPPEAVPETGRKRGWTHKRVSSARLRGTGWEPRYASWFDALDGDPELVPSILAKVG